MRAFTTDYGNVCVGSTEELFAAAAMIGAEGLRTAPPGKFSWALTGGSTPKAWYQWCVACGGLEAEVVAQTQWFVSDERHVPLESGESNFGNATRQLFDPLGVPAANRHPWAVEKAPAEAAGAFRGFAEKTFGPRRAFSLCFLGMGDDCHTASLFPGSALLRDDGGELFAAVEVPGKGWRLTITPTGLRACDRIVVMTTGAGKVAALQRVLRGPRDPWNVPSQILAASAGRVTWLVDEAAAAGL